MLGAANAVDIIVLVVLGLFFVLGIIRGFVLQLAGIAFLVLGLFLASQVSPSFASVLHGWFPNLGSPADHWVAFALILIATIVGGHVLVVIFRGGLDKLKLLAYDRLLGGILGALKAGIVLGLVMWIVIWVSDRGQEGQVPGGVLRSIHESKSWPVVEKVSTMVPKELRDRAQRQAEELRRWVEERPAE